MKDEKRYRDLQLALNTSRIGVWEWDVATGEIQWLEGVESLLGLPPNSFSGNFADYFHLQDWAVTYQAIAHAIETETNHCFEYRILRSDGVIRWIEGKTVLVRDASGCIVRMIGTAIDITERKQMEAGLRESEARLRTQAEIAQAQTQQLKQTLQKLQQTQAQLVQSEKMSSLGQLVAGIAHEINNPVNFIHVNLTHARQYTQDLLHLLYLYQQHYPHLPPEIQAQIQAIDLDFVSEDLPKLLSSMNCGTSRIREIVMSLRNFSRLDEAEMKTVDIHSGIDSTLLILQHRLKATCEYPAIQVDKQYGDLPLVECYAGQLNQVFLNVITNAIDALEEGVGIREWGSRFLCVGVPPVEATGVVETVIIPASSDKYRNGGASPSSPTPYSSLRQPHAGPIGTCVQRWFLNGVSSPMFSQRQEPPHGESGFSTPCIRIHSEVSPDNSHVIIRIADNGPGVAEAVQPKLFDPFFTTKSVGKGRGLGLAISYQIVVEKHGGHLHMASVSGQGSEFIIELPIRQQLYAQPA